MSEVVFLLLSVSVLSVLARLMDVNLVLRDWDWVWS